MGGVYTCICARQEEFDGGREFVEDEILRARESDGNFIAAA